MLIDHWIKRVFVLLLLIKKQKEKPEAKAEKKKPEAKKADTQEPAEKKEKKSLPGGVSVEDTKVGSGPVAKPGKVVMVCIITYVIC